LEPGSTLKLEPGSRLKLDPGSRLKLDPRTDDELVHGAYGGGMSLRTAVYIVWGVFGVYWLVSAVGVKSGARSGRLRPPGLLIIAAVALLRVFKAGSLAVHGAAPHVLGVALLVCGLCFAVWARIYLGRNWGMPMTQKDEPELVTSGPYRFVRHPIYSGILLALAGTALATNLYWLVVLVAIAAYFVYSARVEERLMTASFPEAYTEYRTRTKMLVPFVSRNRPGERSR
jgi:protein-S-isoprenylcysteine O-methyltransferase Ste14